MRRVPWWAVLSATLAPILLIGGWTAAAARQPAAYSPHSDTISALASLGATDRLVMTAGLAGLGICHLVTATGLWPARPAGRIVLAVSGAATVLVAAFPQPAYGGSSWTHRVTAAIALAALAVWPTLSARGDDQAPWGLRPRVTAAVTAGLAGLLALFVAQVAIDGVYIGLTERLIAAAESLWPMVVVLTARWSPQASAEPTADTGDA
jgi:hypothetical membrane protein